jgi:hypothetical protein
MENNFDDEFNHIEESNRDGSSPSAKLLIFLTYDIKNYK